MEYKTTVEQRIAHSIHFDLVSRFCKIYPRVLLASIPDKAGKFLVALNEDEAKFTLY